MKVLRGRDRIAIIFPLIKMVIKLPQIHIFKSFFQLYGYAKENNWKGIIIDWSWPLELKTGFKGLLFHGIAENWREFLFFFKTRNEFLQPTFFSFFGLFNIQLYGNPCGMNYVDLWRQLIELTDGRAWQDNHHFSNPDNFCYHSKKFRILDYGNPQCHEVINLYGKKIVKEFDPNYKKERK